MQHRSHLQRAANFQQRVGNGLARALSKLGFCSRSEAVRLIEAGRVQVNGQMRRNPEWNVNIQTDRLAVDGKTIRAAEKIYLMLNKPRGLVTTTSDEQGRDTVFQCFAGTRMPWIAPVGRLDKASEGLLLFSNDTAWAARLTAPESGLEKTYHVQIDCLADEALLERLTIGCEDAGEHLSARRAAILRHGTKNSWLEIVLDEGRNRHIRRLLSAFGIEVLRLVRVAVGNLKLGSLEKGKWRELSGAERHALGES